MRKHDVRKWLHAVLDLLPVILIPVFMIYSHRHTLTERTEVEINYKYESNEVNTLDDIITNNIYELDALYLSYNNDDFILDLHVLSYNCEFETAEYLSLNDDFVGVSITNYYTSEYDEILLSIDSGEMSLSFPNNSEISTTFVYSDYDLVFYNVIFYLNELNINNFIDWFVLYGDDLPQYTDYNVIESVSVNDTNKDIMTVFMDDFNGAIDNYFNMGNVFNLNGVYEWFNTNIFSGNAPTVIYSIWNIALYELVMDLLFLLYGLFMWFIDMVEHLMEKPFKSIK